MRWLGFRETAWRCAEAAGLTPDRLAQRGGDALLRSVAQMEQDSQSADQHFRAGPIWDDLARKFRRWIALDGLSDVENHPMNGLFASPAPGNPKLLRYAAWMLYNDVRSRDHLGLLDIASASGSASLLIGERRLSWDILISIDAFYQIAETYPAVLDGDVIVGELGAGWGRMGYILRLANPRAKYVVFDLPEILTVAQTYLPQRLPSDTVSLYADQRSKPIGRGTIHADLTFCGSHDLPRVEPDTFDIMINIGSFQEMGQAQVASYLQEFDRITHGCVYTQQIWDADLHAYRLGEISGYQHYGWPQAWVQTHIGNATWSDLYFTASFQLRSVGEATRIDPVECVLPSIELHQRQTSKRNLAA